MKYTIASIAQVLAKLFKKLPINLVYLYGSVAYGKSDKFSDYDFGILFSNQLTEKNVLN